MKVSCHFQAQTTLPQEELLVPNDKEIGWAQGAG